MDTNNSQNSIQELQEDLAYHKNLVAQYQEMIAEYQERIAGYQKKQDSDADEKQALELKVEMLQEQIDSLRKYFFAPKSEKRKHSNDIDDDNKNSLLALLLEDPSNQMFQKTESTEPKAEPEEETQTITYTRTKRRGKKKAEKDPVICREMVPLIDHPTDDPTEIGAESDRTCVCGANLIKTGETEVRKLEYVPGHFEEHMYHKPTYRCPNCSGDEEQCRAVLPAALENEILPEALVTNDFLAQIIYNKYCSALPLYRQCGIFLDYGVSLTRSSMSRWIVSAGEILFPLYDEILFQIQSGDVINMDETRLQVLNEPGRANTQISQLWHMAGGRDGPCRYYGYNVSRSGKVAAEYIGPFQGYLQTDGYAGYNAVGSRDGITHVGCLDHIRRKFVAVTKCMGDTTKTYAIAQQVLDEIKDIYLIERELRALNMEPNAFVEKRSALVQPILTRIFAIIEAKRGLTPAQSLLGKALNYAYGQWQFFCNYLLHPALGPSNQLAENGIRPFVVGRKNYLFAGHPNGARVLGVYYSLIETAKVNGVRPLNYLKHVFSHIRSIPGNRIAELLPWNCGLK